MIDHTQLSQFRSSLSFSQNVNILTYILFHVRRSGMLKNCSIHGVDSTELVNDNPRPLFSIKVGKKKIKIYKDLDCDCGKRRNKRDKSPYVIGHRMHTLTAIIEMKLITADEAYHDDEGLLQKETAVELITPPLKDVKLPDYVDAVDLTVNVLNREFQVRAPNKVWCSDITYLWTQQGWVYLASVIDLYSRKVVGWQIDDHMRTSLVKDALSMAYFRRKPKSGLIHHSDRGSQYAGNEFQKLMKEYQMTGSMSRKGNCWDNAVAESFFRSLKTERTDDNFYHTKEEARRDVIEYIEMFYNSQRLHSTIGYNIPNKFESEYYSNIS